MDPKITDALDKSAAAIEELLKYAASLEESNKLLQSKLATANERNIVLEKVASAPPSPAVDEAAVSGIVTQLVDAGYFSDTDGVKLSTELVKSPTNIIKLASRLISLHTPTQEGSGVPKLSKAASAQGPIAEWELDGWTECFRD